MVCPNLFISSLVSLDFVVPPYPVENYWFSSGDSYSNTGFQVNGTQPSVWNPLGNPPYPDNTTTGGPNWIVAETTIYNKSLIFNYNFADSGATIDADLVASYFPHARSFTDQVSQFLASYGDKPPWAPWESKNALFSVWIGINDIGGSWALGGDRGAFSDLLINAYFALVEKLYEVGARNFLFINVPPIQRTPLVSEWTNDPGRELVRTVIEGFNSRLTRNIVSFECSHPGVATYQWDSYSFITKIIDDPTQHGFQDSTSFGSGQYFWGDGYHPSSPAQVRFAEDVAKNVLKQTIW